MAARTTEALVTVDIVVQAVESIACLLGNTLVIVAVFKFEFLQTKTNMFVVSLAISDLFVGSISIPSALIIQSIDDSNLSNSSYVVWKNACLARSFFQHAGGVGDTLSILAIAIERFLFINFPFKYDRILSKKVATITAILIVLLAVSLSILAIWGSNTFQYGMECSMFNTMAPIMIQALWMPLFGIVSLIVIIFYGKIAHLALSKSKVAPATQEAVSSNELSSTQRKVTTVMAQVIGAFMFTYGVWFVIFFATATMKSIAVLVLQYFATWFWQVGGDLRKEKKLRFFVSQETMSCPSKIVLAYVFAGERLD